MRVFLAGATGVLGRRLLPRLARAAHAVTAMTRSEGRVDEIRAQGGDPVVCDVFDADRVRAVVVAAQPDVVIHQLTNIPPRLHPRRINKELAPTNRLRAEGTQNLMMAATAAAARRFIAQSVAFAYVPTGAPLATEKEPLYRDAPAAADMIHAIDVLEGTVLGTAAIDGLVLRYGYFYGPGTIYARDGSFAADVQRRRVPIVGDGSGVFSFIHVDDAAAATAGAVEHGEPGIYNIVDDRPASVREWLPWYAELLGAPRPLRVPNFVGRLAAGPYGMYLMTEQRGASNRKAKAQLAWAPNQPSWREGFRSELVVRA